MPTVLISCDQRAASALRNATNSSVVARLNQEIVAAVQSPEVRSRFEESLVTPGTGTPEEFVAFLKAEAARWSQLIKTVGIKVD